MTKEQKQLNGGWTAFSINGAGEIEIHQQKKKKKIKKETWPKKITLYAKLHWKQIFNLNYKT